MTYTRRNQGNESERLEPSVDMSARSMLQTKPFPSKQRHTIISSPQLDNQAQGLLFLGAVTTDSTTISATTMTSRISRSCTRYARTRAHIDLLHKFEFRLSRLWRPNVMCERAVSVSVPPILVPYSSRPMLTLDHTRLTVAPMYRKDRAQMLVIIPPCTCISGTV